MSKQEGYLFVDHRASPGLTRDHADRLQVDHNLVREGSVLEAATKRCCHCANVVVINPCRTRERGHCFKCHDYVCDLCSAEMSAPGYEHLGIDEVFDKLKSGLWQVGPGSRPGKIELIPTGVIING